MMHRRTFLKWSSALPLALMAQGGMATALSTSRNMIVVLDGITAQTDAPRLSALLNAFVKQGLPVSCIVETHHPVAGNLRPDTAVSRVLRRLHGQVQGLIDLLPVLPDLAAQTAHFQARSAYDGQQHLFDAIWGNTAGQTIGFRPRAVACDMRADIQPPNGARTSGIRNVLMRPETTQPVQSEAWENGIVRLIGGARVALSASVQDLQSGPAQPGERVLYLSAADLPVMTLAEVERHATAFAQHAQHPDGNEWISPILASDIQFRDAYSYRRKMALHFLASEGSSSVARAILTDFRLDLLNAGLPSSFGATVDAGPLGTDGTGYWIDIQRSKAVLPILPVQDYNMASDAFTPAALNAARNTYGIGVSFRPLATAQAAGITAENTIVVPAEIIQDPAQLAGLENSDFGTEDYAILISDQVLRNAPQRRILKTALLALADDGITTAVTLPKYVRSIVPTDAYLTHYRRTSAYAGRARSSDTPNGGQSQAQLMADAKTAWGYFEKWTNRKTGLCPATVNFSEDGVVLHEAVTMWDVGSQINALIAANELFLISDDAFQTAVRKILPNIAGRKSQGRLLPQGWIVTNRIKWGVKDFDGCDAGRLLAALYNLDTHAATKDHAASTVQSWDLDKVIKDGVIYNVTDGVESTTYVSHCAHYASWAFRTWGHEVRSPYEVFDGKSEADGRIALLEIAGQIGPMGAEPLLLEALELGMSPESEYLAEVLFAAQLEEFDETGVLTCVSEGPIDHEPWFTYQGLQFDAPGRVWATDTVASLPEHRSPEFRKKNQVVSSKGAYLWAAYKNHEYCDRLVDYVREKARTSNGFASSIYQQTGKATQTYADINTNAVILQSIAQMMRNRQNQ
ncbi:MAG: hypothetical protein ACJAVM_002937 [Sulfitobacter sp.]|jgi:hypothetical protein